jgi:hypothetical protein
MNGRILAFIRSGRELRGEFGLWVIDFASGGLEAPLLSNPSRPSHSFAAPSLPFLSSPSLAADHSLPPLPFAAATPSSPSNPSPPIPPLQGAAPLLLDLLRVGAIL